MKLIRFGAPGAEKPGVVLDEQYYDVSPFVADYDEAFFAGSGIEQLADVVAANKESLQPVGKEVRLGAPIARPSKIVCIGLNYTDHAKETGATLPSEPVVFMKATTALCGPNDDTVIPRNSEKTDWEVELAVVIGKRASYVEEAEAMEYIAGYCLHNDLSERAFQLERQGTWDKGKGCDTFAPLGPWLATKDEVADVHNLRLWLTLNGEKMQDGNTANLVFNIPHIISYVSQFMTLLPGDVISTGTPAGVGLGMNPQVYLKPGDVVELGIDGLGTSRQQVVAYGQ
ncbi:2-keto-4-pentenoate hydratase/2-oxohepta-3-ene-1,7-dioic acid hydratase (catechol pathway) [Cnuella takakiae]|uniref:2-keto-4-pentenoate hydratase/2-oxohepta-3-ene-1,7-dioic acid hydratase (Catechol pathway) n=1 Tax=Cnuella takakiae TaxID=1302690 RepID=A0A1M4T1L9_9BACT|nr:fumarylacetoacetate hydrolase family protein [Cnuella takakiae]OLY90657.1 ureidoglycolate lyase [Cnuella takakiae]SHE38280.1 2-keto-4-pentenoate hydratase/2-oxohepta-3-ene-1,7-dioic acid hydratase (catechol pathway) [Cnuella takakiae]